MVKTLHADFETASEVELSGKTGVGLHNYCLHPSTRVLMLGYAFDDGEPMLWEPHSGPMPADLLVALQNPDVEIMAFNSAFERYILQYKLNITIPASRFQDPQASARYLSLPASLDDVGMVLGLPKELRKDKRGEELIDLFSKPHTRSKKLGGGTYFNNWESHPKEWEEFKSYCAQDIRAEREVARREYLLGAFPLPTRERKIWLFDQGVNDRGIPVDRDFVQKALRIAKRNKQEKLEDQNKITGLENANSQTQLLPWVRERGYPINNLRKQNIQLVLKNPEYQLTEECRNVLTARMEAASTSYTKLDAIIRNLSPDDRLRNQFIYMGSSRCGRWSGSTVQLHNLARPDATFEDMENVIKARNLIYQEDYDGIKMTFSKHSPLTVIRNLIRTVFIAEKGRRLNVADLSAIETRVGAWISGCEPLLRVFAEHKDPYLDLASKMTGISYQILWDDYKGKNGKDRQIAAKRHRQMAKPAVLGAIYRLSGGGWGKDKNGDIIKTGMWGYAEAMGVEMSQEQAHEIVKIFREVYAEVPKMWGVLEHAIEDVLTHERTVRQVGPDNCIKIDKITVEGRGDILRIQLPSGRHIHYFDAAIEEMMMPWKRKNSETGEEEPVFKPSFCYYGLNQDTKNWELIVSHGGKTFENIVQGIARDIIAECALRIEEKYGNMCACA